MRLYDQIASIDRLTVNGSGNVGIGTASPLGRKLVVGASSDTLTGILLQANNANWYIDNRGSNDSPFNRLDFSVGGNDLLTILPGGNVGIGTTNPLSKLSIGSIGCNAAYGICVSHSGTGYIGTLSLATGANSQGLQAQGGSYGVVGNGGSYDFYASGVGVNYSPFTGAHEVKLSDDVPTNIKAGMLVSVTGEMQMRKDDTGKISISSTLPTVKLSNTANDKAVFGVFVLETALYEEHWHKKKVKEGERYGAVNAVGEGRVLVTNMNGDIEPGDYITTSPIPGYGQKQNDDLLHSYTAGKATEKVDWGTVTETIEFQGTTYKVYLISVVYTSG